MADNRCELITPCRETHPDAPTMWCAGCLWDAYEAAESRKCWTLEELHAMDGEWTELRCPGAAEWQDDISAFLDWLGKEHTKA